MSVLPDFSRLALPTGAPKKRAKPTVRPFYGILQLEPNATQEEVRRNYLLLSRKVHPDKNPGDEQAASRFIQLKEAYDTLSDPERRERYDRGESASDDSAAFADAYHYFRGTPINTEDIDAFLDSYRGSAVEQEDLLAYFKENDGDISMLLAHIVGSRDEDVPRYIEGFKRALAANQLPRKYSNRKKYPLRILTEAELENYDEEQEELSSDEEDDDDAAARPVMLEELMPEQPPPGVPPALWASMRAAQQRRNQGALLALTDKRKR